MVIKFEMLILTYAIYGYSIFDQNETYAECTFLDIHESNFFLTSDYGEIILRFLVLATHELMCDNRFEALMCLYVINLCPLI